MARFARYFFKFHNEFASYDWEQRQSYLDTFFDTNDKITFEEGEGNGRKVYKHRVHRLACAPKIIVMQFANDIDIPVELNYEPAMAKDEPSCFIIIDNRDGLRSVAIQKRKKAFANPGQVAKIIGGQISKNLYAGKCYSLEIMPEFYPEDLFKAWETLQRSANAIRFGVPEMEPDEILEKVEKLKKEGKDYFDDSLMPALAQIALEAKKAKYKQQCIVMPEDKKAALYIDKTSVYMKNMLTLSRALNMPVEIVTSDSGTFKCFVESDEENTDKIMFREFNAELLEKLFRTHDKDGNLIEADERVKVEGQVLELMNSMKHQSEDDEGDYAA